jgi:hypothetical protein
LFVEGLGCQQYPWMELAAGSWLRSASLSSALGSWLGCWCVTDFQGYREAGSKAFHALSLCWRGCELSFSDTLLVS